MSRPLLLSTANLRLDHRRPLEIRPISISFPAHSASLDGYASIEHGLTHVEVGIAGPKEPLRGQGGSRIERASLEVEVIWAAFANTSEKRRRGRTDRRLIELGTSVKNTFEPVIMAHLYPRSQINIYIHVLQADGGVLAAAINAATLALIHAGIALSSPVSAVSLACLHDVPLLDASATEESDLPNITVACLAPKHDEGPARVTLVNLETRLSIDRFEAMLKLAADACAVVREELEAALRLTTTELARKLRKSDDKRGDVEMED